MKDTVGKSSRSGSTPVGSAGYSPMASAAHSRPPVHRKSFSPLNLKRPSVNISSAHPSGNRSPKVYVRYRREKVGDFASSSRRGMSERDRELKPAEPAPKSKSTAEVLSENRRVLVRGDEEIDFYLLKESSKLKKIVTSDRGVVKPPLKNSAEKKTAVSDRRESLLKPVKKRIISEIMKQTSAKNKGTSPPPVSLKINSGSGCSSEKLNDLSSIPMKAKSSKTVSRFGNKTKSTGENVNGGSLNPITAEDSAPKTWNLRPRQPPASNSNGANLQRSMADEKATEALKSEKPKKTEFSISLSKAEIEADFLAMTGSKPPKKSQKRGRVVQKNLDYCFPGLWLNSITPSSYDVSEKESKI